MTLDGQSPPGLAPSRPVDAHKGTFGTVMVIGGCDDHDSCMVGGPAFSAHGALRSGAGRVVMATPRGILGHCLEVAPSATGMPIDSIPFDDHDQLRERLNEFQAIVLGPGLGSGSEAEHSVRSVLACGTATPVVLDADGLNIASRFPEWIVRAGCPLVLTPHPGEYERFAAAMGLPASPRSEVGRLEAASDLGRGLGVVAVLKGMGTVVAFEDSAWVCTRGTPALATAGTGDVLSGMIAGLVAQEAAEAPSVLWKTACLAVWIHAVSAERWSLGNGESGLMAVELAGEVPAVMKSLPRS